MPISLPGEKKEVAKYAEAIDRTPRFLLPSVSNSPKYCSTNFGAEYEDGHQRVKFCKGTTTLAFKYQGGVIVSVDSRATQGQFIASNQVHKVIEVNPFLLGTMAGGASDCYYFERRMGVECRLYELRNGERISVAGASKILVDYLYHYKGYGLSVGTMICGWDKTGPQIYYVDNDGSRLKADEHRSYFSVGSGSSYAYGVLDQLYHWDMTDEEAIDLGKRAIFHATHRDAMSGGFNNVYLIKPEGWKQISHIDVKDLWDQYGMDH
ncbi:hypothetical protein WA588_000943 [Blastocystis sp. NMH]